MFNSKQHIIPIILMALIMSLLSGCGSEKYTVLTNGTFYTMDKENPSAQTIVFKDGVIIFAGDDAAAGKYSGGEVIDLQGAVVIPGLIDAHAHLHSLGKSLQELNLRGMDSIAEIREKVLQKAKISEKGEWISGRGWDQNLWEDKSFPSLNDLQGITDNPVILVRVDGHAAWVNETALNLCGIGKNTPDPEGGRILRGNNGEPTGILLDNAIELVRKQIPRASDALVRHRLISAMKECNKYGLTGVGDAYQTQKTIQACLHLADERAMTLRVYGMLADSADLLDEFFPNGPIIDYGDRFTLRAVKMFADGALGSRGGLLFTPYDDDKSTSGIEVSGEDSIYHTTSEALKAGFQVCTHAIGDKANHSTLNGYEKAINECGVDDHRLRIEHCQILAQEDISRFARLGIIASMQPTHATSDMPWAEDRVGSQRIKGAYAWRSMLDSGARLAFGSDFPVERVNPFLGIYAAVTRQDSEGNPPGGWYPEQRLTVYEAVAAFTSGAAYAQFQEDQLGMIKAGMKADFTVIDRDIFLVDPVEILDTVTLMTIVGGEIVYDALD